MTANDTSARSRRRYSDLCHLAGPRDTALQSSTTLPRLAIGKTQHVPNFRAVKAVLLCLLCLISASAFGVDPLTFTDRAEEARFQQLTRELRCLVCQNQNLADSDAGLARDLRLEVYEQLRSGKSNAEIKQYLVARYSDFVLYDPPVRGATWLLWFGPLLAVAVGGGVVGLIVRRRTRGNNVAVAGAAVDDKEDW